MKLDLPESETPGLLGKRAIITKVLLSVAKLLGPLATTLTQGSSKKIVAKNRMDETRTIDEALPTAGADDDQAASPGPIATGPTQPTQFRRAARRPLPTAIKLVEDMMPRDLFIAGVMGGGYLLPSNYPSLAVVNRFFNDTMCQPRVILFRV